MSRLGDRLKRDLKKSKEYRHGYADEFLNESIATQIKVLREQRGWTQEQLAEEAKMKQSRISVLENVNYEARSISTLKRLAEAFDLTLRVSFESFGSRLVDIERFSRESLERFPFEEDRAFTEIPIEKLNASQALKDSFHREGSIVSIDAYRAKKDGILQQIPTKQHDLGASQGADKLITSAAGAR